MRERLAELNWRTQPNSLEKGAGGEAAPHFDSKPGEVVASPPSLSAQQVQKAG
jgi:hypothetical protein